MKKFDLSKVLFFGSLAFAVFLYGVGVGTYKLFPHGILNQIKKAIVLVYEERRTLAKIEPEHFLYPARHDGNGVTKNTVPSDRKELVFLSGFFKDTNELRLIRRDGAVVARWPVQFSKYFPDTSHLKYPPETDWNTELHGAVINRDGSVVFNFEYGGLVKLDRCGGLVWTLALPTHHSVERAESGGYWVPARRYFTREKPSPYPPYETPFNEDVLLKVSEDGKVLEQIPTVQLLYDNGLEALLTSGSFRFGSPEVDDTELVHLNKIDELTSDIASQFPEFEAGDLMLSFRGLNLLMVISPKTRKVKWWKVGPWLRQHDPNFQAGGKITLFNNNVFFTYTSDPAFVGRFENTAAKMGSPHSSFGPGTGNLRNPPPGNANVMELDPVSGSYKILYGDRKGQELFTIYKGTVDRTPTGNMILSEPDAGRVLEFDGRQQIIWEYVNRYDAKRVAILTGSRVLPENYFRPANWPCR